jgi:hypothetical protein
MSITFDTAWTAIAAAEELGRTRGLELDSHLTPERLRLEFRRGRNPTCELELNTALLDACADLAAVRVLVEREVAVVLRHDAAEARQ